MSHINVITRHESPVLLHDGMHEEQACLRVPCAACGHVMVANLLLSLGLGERWYRSLTESKQRDIAVGFGYAFETLGKRGILTVRFHHGRTVRFIPIECPACCSST